MGAVGSKVDDDKALLLCRVRKKCVRQALDGRCALAAAHVAYILSLKTTASAITKFVPVESSLYTSTTTSVTPEPQRVETTQHLPPSRTTGRGRYHYHVHHMNFRGSFTRKVEENPPIVITATVTSLGTPLSTTPSPSPRSIDRTNQSPPSQTPIHQPQSPTNQPWDYFGLFHPIHNHFSSHDQREVESNFVSSDDLKHISEDEVVSQLEDGESQGSESDEFDDPSSDTLVRRFQNLNRDESYANGGASPTVPTAGSVISENGLSDEEKVNSPRLSPLKRKSSQPITPVTKATSVKDEDFEYKIPPKDFFLSIKEVEHLFVKASESGKEVPRMLEANKLHFRPLLPGKESGMTRPATLLKACFSCGKDPSQVRGEPTQTSVKYLTWHRTTSFPSSSSRNFRDSHPREEVEDLTSDLFDDLYMISESHASNLDRLFAWERKLYDEVKASQLVRREYDMKCKILRQQETKCESQHTIDKTRTVVKDLHSRIGVAIHRIDSISRRIEELREKELQPQLEELIKGLRKMWEVMFDCHKLQVHIITTAISYGGTKLSLQSESRRHLALLLEDELGNLSSNFTKWINALNTYIEAINNWLNKCVNFQEKSSKKRKWTPPPHLRLRNAGPAIYTTCGAWLDFLKNLPVKEVSDTIRGLANEISHLIPHHERVHGKKTLHHDDPALEMHSRQAFEEWDSRGYDKFQTSFVIFLSQICNFAERSVKMYSELETNIEEAKRNYEQKMSQP